MTLQQIDYYLEVARRASFTAAADALYVSVSNLSRQISALEREIGKKLFKRNHNGIALTDTGEYLFRELSAIMDRLNCVITQAALDQLSIGLPEGVHILEKQLSDFLISFELEFPTVVPRMEKRSWRDLMTGLLAAKYDVVSVFSFVIDPADAQDIIYVPLADFTGSILLSSTHPLADKDCIRIRDVCNDQFIHLSRSLYTLSEQIFADAFRLRGAPTPSNIMYVPTVGDMLLNVEAGNGVCLVSGLETLPENSGIVMLPIDNEEYRVEPMSFGLAWRKSARVSPCVRFMADWFKREMRSSRAAPSS